VDHHDNEIIRTNRCGGKQIHIEEKQKQSENTLLASKKGLTPRTFMMVHQQMIYNSYNTHILYSYCCRPATFVEERTVTVAS
jgi:hypothetical protein